MKTRNINSVAVAKVLLLINTVGTLRKSEVLKMSEGEKIKRLRAMRRAGISKQDRAILVKIKYGR